MTITLEWPKKEKKLTHFGFLQVVAHDKDQRYKEGKFVLERYQFETLVVIALTISTHSQTGNKLLSVYASIRWRIADDVAEEFNLDARPGSSDAEMPQHVAAIH